MQKLREFSRDFASSWTGLMGGIFSVVFWAASAVAEIRRQPMSVSLSFFASGAIAAILAAFKTWQARDDRAKKTEAGLRSQIPPPIDERTYKDLQGKWAEHTDTERVVIERLYHVGIQDHTQLRTFLANQGLTWQAANTPHFVAHEDRSVFIRLDSQGRYSVPDQLRPYIQKLTRISDAPDHR